MSDFKRIPPCDNNKFSSAPWEFAVEPFRCAPHVWYVAGHSSVAVYMIDTGDGLILIDSGFVDTLYMLTESIRKIGYNPYDIKHIFISHGHFDHYDGATALKKLTGAKIWCSKEDCYFSKIPRYPADVKVHPFVADACYEDDQPITMGKITIRTKLTPGHSPGTTSFFFDDTDDDTGVTYHVGMHGGVGSPHMSHAYIEKYGYPGIRERFLKDCAEMADWDIDICLASHANQTNFLSGVNENDRSDYSEFVDKSVWKMLMLERINAVNCEP